jgi:hypothetical protein
MVKSGKDSFDCRIADFVKRPKLLKRWNKFLYKRRMQEETRLYNLANTSYGQKPDGRYLYASPVGKDGKQWLKKIIERFGYEKFDYIIFAYDDVSFDEEIFQKCTILREKGLHYYFLKKHITPSVCSKYDYIFAWCDDIDVGYFNPEEFLKIMKNNNLQVAQPALTSDSYFTWVITLQDKTYRIGRYVDFVEVMVPVFTRESWVSYWNMVEPDRNYWGWGYDFFARSVCRYANMGIIDSQPVRHVRPVGERRGTGGEEDVGFIKDKYSGFKIAEKVSYGSLS